MIPKKRTPTIKGIIIPCHWDENGNIKEVSLHTDDEKEYHVEKGLVLTHTVAKLGQSRL